MKVTPSIFYMAAFLAVCPLPVDAQASQRAKNLHQDAFVMDAHVHITNRQFFQGGSIGDRYPDGQVDLPRMIDGGVDALFYTLLVDEEYYPARLETKQALRLINHALMDIESNSDRIEVALSASDVDRIHAAGKVAAVLDLEGSIDLDGDLGILRSFHRLGLRVLQLPAHNWANEYADSCCAEQKFGGLNDHGRAFIREMNRLGMVINISHASDETIEQAIEVSKHPLVATHHGLRSFNDIPRVMPDDLLRKLVAKGGLIGIHIGQSFHSIEYFKWKSALEGGAFWDTTSVEEEVEGQSITDIDDSLKGTYPRVGPIPSRKIHMTIDDWLNVVERAMEVAGEDHVILGTDLDGFPTPPLGMTDISDLPLLTEGMLRRGWSEERIRKFLGGNLLRVFREISP